MPWEAWLTLAVIFVLLVALARSWASPDALVLGALTSLMVVGALFPSERLPSPKAAVEGFGNPAPLTVAVLFAVVSGLVHTGALGGVSRWLGRPRSVVGAQVRLALPVWSASAFLNNTPIVAMFLPVVADLSRRTGISPSKLFIPLSYASILGGICTLIGTSTNLVVNGLLVSQHVMPEGLAMFDITWLGLPCAVVGLTFIIGTSRWLLPDRKPAFSTNEDPREYTVELVVDPGGPLVGKSIEAAGLRHLPGLFLTSIQRNGSVIPAVGPLTLLGAGDRLGFAGLLESVVDLRAIRGLSVPDELTNGKRTQRSRVLIEAVVSDSCSLVGSTIRDGKFRTRHDAAIVALARGGRRVMGKLGDAVLRAGDTLLLEAEPEFLASQQNSRQFFLVSRVDAGPAPRHGRAPLAIAILLGMILAASFDWLDMLTAASLAAALMIATGCTTVNEARRAVDWSVLLVIGGALGLGQALTSSGAATAIAGGLVAVAGAHPWMLLASVYFVTILFTEVITNNAAVALVFPIAIATAKSVGVSPLPFVMCLMVAGSASFATPIGYQTNLMVYGPGGYGFLDFVRIGLPLNLVMMVVAVSLAPLIWPF